MDFVTADGFDPAALLDGANDAFSDYTVPTPAVPRPAWEEMLHQRGFDPSLSWLAVKDGAVEAYWLVGTEIEARPGQSYGISVGTRPRARRQGLSTRLWTRVAEQLRAKRFRHHQLEVIETNSRAVPLYEGLGFHAARRIECFKGAPPAPLDASDIELRDVTIDEAERVAKDLREWEPSWQNATTAVRNLQSTTTATLALEQGLPVAFGYFHRPYGQVVQIAVCRDRRRRGLGRALVRHWGQQTDRDTLSTLNVPDTDKGSLAFFRALGWENHVNQFEMHIDL